MATGKRPAILLHDKVIQTKNNYNLGVMNGAIDYVIAVDNAGNLTVDFDGFPIEYSKGTPLNKTLRCTMHGRWKTHIFSDLRLARASMLKGKQS